MQKRTAYRQNSEALTFILFYFKLCAIGPFYERHFSHAKNAQILVRSSIVQSEPKRDLKTGQTRSWISHSKKIKKIKKNHGEKAICKEKSPMVFLLKFRSLLESNSSLKSENFGESETRDRIYSVAGWNIL